MKNLLLILCCVLGMASVKAQINLVENPSFEVHDSCPENQDHVSYALGWNNFGGSPDYFNSCSFNWQFFVPTNWGGYQQAASGNAYCAFDTYAYVANYPNIREFIGGGLSNPMSIGTKYYVSFKISLSLDDTIQTSCATNHIGAMFSTIRYNWQHPVPLTNNPAIYTNTIITDTVGWTTIFGSFVADSSYHYIIIGNFFDDLHTDTLILDSNIVNTCSAYYFLDNVCVSTDSAYSYNYIYTGINEINNPPNISVYPNPADDYINIDFSLLNEPYTITIYDVLGREVFLREKINEPIEHIPIDNINSNILFIQIKYKNQL